MCIYIKGIGNDIPIILTNNTDKYWQNVVSHVGLKQSAVLLLATCRCKVIVHRPFSSIFSLFAVYTYKAAKFLHMELLLKAAHDDLHWRNNALKFYCFKFTHHHFSYPAYVQRGWKSAGWGCFLNFSDRNLQAYLLENLKMGSNILCLAVN